LRQTMTVMRFMFDSKGKRFRMANSVVGLYVLSRSRFHSGELTKKGVSTPYSALTPGGPSLNVWSRDEANQSDNLMDKT